MRNTHEENLAEHSSETAILAHALATISNTVFKNALDADRAATLALFHDASEVFTGDLPTPVKYCSDGMRENYRRFEEESVNRLLSRLPEPLRESYSEIMHHREGGKTPSDVSELIDEGMADEALFRSDDYLHFLVKAADRLAAYIKCVEEKKSGNGEFDRASETVMDSIKKMHCREADWFAENLLSSFSLTLDGL